MTVRVDWTALLAAWEEAEWNDFVWELVLEEPGDVVLLVNEAIVEVNELLDPLPGPGGPSSEWCTETVPGVAALIRPVGELHEVRAWYDELAGRLESRGISGRLGPGRPDPRPDWLEASADVTTPTAILGFDAVEPGFGVGERGWGGSPADVAATVDPVLAWLEEAGGTLFWTRYLFTDEVTDDSGLATALRRSLARCFTTTLARVTGPGQGRIVAWEAPGLLTVQVAGAADAAVAIDSLLDLLRLVGPRARAASVRLAPVPTRGWRTTAGLPPVSPSWDPARLGSQEDRMDQLPALRATRVVDAYGAQVLTDAHLARLAGLPPERWRVESLGSGRHLVVARDLAAWFTGDVPDPALLAAARADLEPLLLRPDVPA